jgi:hypothetical protein
VMDNVPGLEQNRKNEDPGQVNSDMSSHSFHALLPRFCAFITGPLNNHF